MSPLFESWWMMLTQRLHADTPEPAKTHDPESADSMLSE